MNDQNKKRIVYFLLLSCLFHLLLFYSFSRFRLSDPDAKKDRQFLVDLVDVEKPRTEKPAAPKKQPKPFDAMEVKEALSEVPASLSQNRGATSAEARPPPPKPPVSPAEKKEQPKQVARAPARPPAPPSAPRKSPSPPVYSKGPGTPEEKPDRQERENRKHETIAPHRSPRREETQKPSSATREKLPSVKDLIPSLNDVLAMKAPGGSLYEDPAIVQDGPGERQARVWYDEYLSELKSRVKLNWLVSEDPYMHESTTVLLIVVNRDGSLASVTQLKGSGMPAHDTETLYAVRRSFPMRPPPEVLLDEQGKLTIHFSFYFLVRRASASSPPDGLGRLSGDRSRYGFGTRPPGSLLRW
jgi:TonB family protein